MLKENKKAVVLAATWDGRSPFSLRLRAKTTPSVALARAARIADAIAPLLGADRADELAANMAGCEEPTLAETLEAVDRRRVHFGLLISNEIARECALAILKAWES